MTSGEEMAAIPSHLTYYDILGVARSASEGEIRTAYLRLVKIYHPDLARPSRRKASIQIFQLITAAYATLGKPHARREYDAALLDNTAEAPVNDNDGGLWERLFR